MKFFQKLPIYLTVITLTGCIYAWLMALARGFSSQKLVCLGIKHDGSCSFLSHVYWTDNTIFWLVPYILVTVLATWLIAAKIIPASAPSLLITFIFILSFTLIFVFAFTQDDQKRPIVSLTRQILTHPA
jgi:hypothetical protein